MGAQRRDATRASVRAMRRLALVSWGVLAVGLPTALVVEILGTADSSQGLLLAMLAVFFVAIVAQVIVGAVVHRNRRPAMISLAVGLCLWAVGSAALTAGENLKATTFPAPGEWLFLSSYLGIATFLLLDARRRTSHPGSIWLETTVVCGGVATVAAAVVLTPVATRFPAEGMALLLALLYPLIDVVLAIMVIAQAVLRLRDRSRRTGMLVAGLFALAVADSSLALNLASSTYVSNVVIDLLYGVAFALIATAACMRHRVFDVPVENRQHSSMLLGAALIALLALAFRPSGAAAWYVTVPAVITLIASGWRLVLALREAQGSAEALRLSRTDELTGLPNRRSVLQDLQLGFIDGRPLALMLLDLDGFKDINDSLGHAAGDAVLRAAADRMRSFSRPDRSVARLGGDEFAVLVREDDPIRLLEIAHELRDSLLEPLQIDGLELAIRASIGVTVRGAGDTGATDLLRRADVAMYEAKVTRSGTLLYDAARDGFSRQRLRMSEELRRGISEDQLVVWYQPQMDAATQHITGVEALVRWEHPTHGLMQPLHFLPDARRSGLMLALSEAVAHRVVTDARRWMDSGFDFRVAMNCAPPELMSGSLLPRLFESVQEAELRPETLLVEVTEDSFLSDPERAREMILELRENDIQVSIDDYGTGFSSLAYLRDLPVQELKMDRSFVATIRSDARSRVIVTSTMQMAHAMGLRMVAEGVEDAETAAELIAMGVDVLQGIHVARPMAATELGPWVRQWSAGLAAAPSNRARHFFD